MHGNKYFRQQALGALDGHWKPSVLATFVYVVIVLAVSAGSSVTELQPSLAALAIISSLVSILVLAPIEVGYYNAFRLLFKGESDDCLNNMFSIGFGKYGRNLGGMLLYGIVICLWTLLLIIPGIIMSFAYLMTPFILNDRPDLSVGQALKLSRTMMKGHKWQLFCLELSFIGWALLSILTLGIGFLWLEPYVLTSIAAFYEELKSLDAPQQA